VIIKNGAAATLELTRGHAHHLSPPSPKRVTSWSLEHSNRMTGSA